MTDATSSITNSEENDNNVEEAEADTGSSIAEREGEEK